MSNFCTSNNSVPQQANTAGAPCPSTIPSMPKHLRLDEWPLPYPLSALFQYVFTGLCILAYGHTTLEHVWITAVEDGETWTRERKLMATRLNQNNVTAGLFLAALTGWLSSSPPVRMILDYTTRGPYVSLLTSFAFVCGSIFVGSAVLYAMPMVTGTWFRMTLMRNRSCVCGTLFMVTYPFLSIAAGISAGIIGFLLAAFNSQDWLVRSGGISLVLLPISVGLGFAWSQISVFMWRNKEQELASKE